jgi:hypothetical protein
MNAHRCQSSPRFQSNRAAAEPAEDDALLVDDEAGVTAALLEALAHDLEAVVEAAGGNVGPEVGSSACLASVRTFER